jgi:NAD(P)-dependent dehydrogenase (short-subunit alcohol dehydrogenase family)
VDDFANRIAVVTGAGRGIGLSMARAFGAAGMHLVLADLSADSLRDAAARLRADGREVVTVPTDVRDAAQVQALADRAISAFGSVDLICNNAGIWHLGAQWETDLADWRRVVDVNLWGVVHGIRSFVPLLIDNPRGGHVVNVASLGGVVAGPFRGPYTAAKHAVVGLSRGLRAELRARHANVGVSVVCPGKVDTAIFDELSPSGFPDDEAPQDVLAAAETIRAFRAIPPAEVGPVVREGVARGDFWILPGVRGQTRAVIREAREMLSAFEQAETA